MKYTIATVAAIAGICSAAPLAAENADDSHKIVCYSPHKSSTFCGDLVQNFDWMSSKKTQSADATWDINSKGDVENVKLCFSPEKKDKAEKCYHAQESLGGSSLLQSTLIEDFKGKITLVINHQVFSISKSKDLMNNNEKRAAQAATAPASTSAAPLALVTGFPRNGTGRANATAPANANLGYQTSYVTKTVPSYVTYCPSATVFTQNKVVYTVTAPSLVTITSCPCTILSATVVPVASVKTVSTAPFLINNGTAPQGTALVSGSGLVSGTGVAVVTATAVCPTCPAGNGNAASNNGAASGTGVSGVSGNNGNSAGVNGASNNGAAFGTGVSGVSGNNGNSAGVNGASNAAATNAGSNATAGSNAAATAVANADANAAANAAATAGANTAANAAANAAQSNAAQSNAGAVGASTNATNPTNAAQSNAGAVGASTTAGSTNAQATNSNVSLFQGAAPGSAIPGTLGALVAVAVAACLFL